MKNYKELSNQLLIYFKSLISKPSILNNKSFQNGIGLSDKSSNQKSALLLKQHHFTEYHYDKSLQNNVN